MCMQCMAGAMTATAGAAGVRAWLATRAFGWLTATRLKGITIVLVVGALMASTILVSGSGGSASASPSAASGGSGASGASSPAAR